MIDGGANHSVVFKDHKKYLHSFKTTHLESKGFNSSVSKIIGEGYLILNLNGLIIKVHAYLVDGTGNPIIAQRQLEEEGADIKVVSRDPLMKTLYFKSESIDLVELNHLFYLSSEYVVKPSPSVNINSVHTVCGHINYRYLLDSINHGTVVNVPPIEIEKLKNSIGKDDCPTCMIGKARRSNAVEGSRNQYIVPHPFNVVYTDVCQVERPMHSGRPQYFISFKDSYTGFTKVYCISNKSDVHGIILKFIKWVETQFDTKVKSFFSDQGSEYLNQEVAKLLGGNGIELHLTSGYTPASNGVAERLNLTIMNDVRSMLIGAHLPSHFWPEAVYYSVMLRNNMWNSVLNNSPSGCLGIKPLNYKSLHIFGEKVFIKLLPEGAKTDERSVPGIYLGYSPVTFGSVYFVPDDPNNLTVGKLNCSRHVEFTHSHEMYTASKSVSEHESFVSTLEDDLRIIYPSPDPNGSSSSPITSQRLSPNSHQSSNLTPSSSTGKSTTSSKKRKRDNATSQSTSSSPSTSGNATSSSSPSTTTSTSTSNSSTITSNPTQALSTADLQSTVPPPVSAHDIEMFIDYDYSDGENDLDFNPSPLSNDSDLDMDEVYENYEENEADHNLLKQDVEFLLNEDPQIISNHSGKRINNVGNGNLSDSTSTRNTQNSRNVAEAVGKNGKGLEGDKSSSSKVSTPVSHSRNGYSTSSSAGGAPLQAGSNADNTKELSTTQYGQTDTSPSGGHHYSSSTSHPTSTTTLQSDSSSGTPTGSSTNAGQLSAAEKKKLMKQLAKEAGSKNVSKSSMLVKKGTTTKSTKSLTSSSTRERLQSSTTDSTSIRKRSTKWDSLPTDGIASRIRPRRAAQINSVYDCTTIVYDKENPFSNHLARRARLAALTCVYLNAMMIYAIYLPKSYQQAISCADAIKWTEAIAAEFKAHAAMETWGPNAIETDDATILANAISTHWIFNIKSDGRYKARLVARGDRQSSSTYDEVYSPTLRPEIARSIFSLAVNKKWYLHQYDFTTAYLNSVLDTDVYIYPPPGYATHKSKSGKRVVYKLKRGLYGLKQAGRLWHATLSKTLKELGYENSTAFPSTFVLKRNGKVKAVIGLFVDDMIFTAAKEGIIKSTIAALKSKYELKEIEKNDDGKNRFLGIDLVIKRNNRGRVMEIIMSQKDYINKFCAEQTYDTHVRYNTPLPPNFYFTPNGEEIFADQKSLKAAQTNYRSIIGTLLYMSLMTRPDITYAVNYLARFSDYPHPTLVKMLHRVVSYANSTSDYSIKFVNNGTIDSLSAYADSDFAQEPTTRKSMNGFMIYSHGNLIHWKSKYTPLVCTSSTEAEQQALMMAVCELKWERELQLFIGNMDPRNKILIQGDNKGAISQMVNDGFSNITKHFAVRIAKLKEEYSSGRYKVEHINGEHNLSDVLTKPISVAVQKKLIPTIMYDGRNQEGVSEH